MSFNHDNVILIMEEYKLKMDPKPVLIILKTIVDRKEMVALDVTDYHGQHLCQTMANLLTKQSQEEVADIEIIEIVCNVLIKQVTFSNTRWYLICKCHILEILIKQFLSTSNHLIQIKIAKTVQIFLIHSQDDENKSSISENLVAQLFQELVKVIRGDFSQEYNEVSLGLLASLCQVWAGCPQIMNVIDDYLVLRKQLLRFLSADIVKRTTIVHTMTIMFHLCNSDDRLFNKRNIRQTLQVLFNIMLNCDTELASLYAARLLTEICKSSKTCHFLSEYRLLSSSLKDSICQIVDRDIIVAEKHLEFIFVITKTSPEYRRMLAETLLCPMESGRSASSCDSNITCNYIDILISKINYPHFTISEFAIKILNEIYKELMELHNTISLPNLRSLAESINEFLSTAICRIASISCIPSSSDDRDPSVIHIKQYINNRDYLYTLSRVKDIIQLITNLLASGDQWLDQVPNFLPETDKFITEQINSDALNENISLLDSNVPLIIIFINVEIFIDLLFFYYKATEIRPTSSLFGERLKFNLEQPKCPNILAFGLSAAAQNQITLQRALVLQGVCLHLQDFNVEILGEKMYKFSSEFAALNFQIPNLENHLNTQLSHSERYNVTETDLGNGDNYYFQNDNCLNSVNHTLHAYNKKCFQFNKQYSVVHHPNETFTTNQNSAEKETTKNHSSISKSANLSFAKTIFSNFTGENIDKINLDIKVQEIVNKWIDNPETKFSSNEIYSIFEYRIESMQNQEMLMEEMLANKTAALHQSEILLNQYRSKLNSIEKESKQLRCLHVEKESLFESFNKTIEEQEEKIKRLEISNQKMTETIRTNDKHKEECLVISKKLQERLVKVSEEKSKLQANLQNYTIQVEEFQNIITQKDFKIANYIQVTKLINKLTGNKFPLEGITSQINIEDLNKSIKSPTQSDCYSNSNNNSK